MIIERESELVDELYVNSEDTYNLKLGGRVGALLSEESKQKISDAIRGGRNPRYGIPWTEEEKKAKSDAYKGRALWKDPKASGAKSSKTKTGVPHSEAHTKVLSKNLANLRSRTTTCPHCGKIGSHPAMVRWHLDNCKQKKATP